MNCYNKRILVEDVLAEHRIDVMVFPGAMDLPAVIYFPGLQVPSGYTSEGGG